MTLKKPMFRTRSNTEGCVALRNTPPEENYEREDFFRDLKKDEPDSQWEHFRDTLKKIAAVPKEEVDEMRAEHEREKKEKRAE